MNKKYIQLGEKNEKGKIIKAENYTFDDIFEDALFKSVRNPFRSPLGFFDRLSKRKFQKELNEKYRWGYERGVNDVRGKLIRLIIKDRLGKKRE